MTTLTYLKGDVTEPQGEGHKIIPHVCNNEGKWGAGVSGAIGKKFPIAEKNYRSYDKHKLGDVDFTRNHGNDDVTIANMIAQHSTGAGHVNIAYGRYANDSGEFIMKENMNEQRSPIRYGALSKCMSQVAAFCRADNEVWASIHAPRFGAGLAGGHWPTIESMILEHWVDIGIDVTIYDL